MKDQLVKALVLNGNVRVYAARTTDLVQVARDHFDTSPTATAALGRVLSVASVMGGMLKSKKEMLTININGNGPAGSIIADAYANGDVRGFIANPLASAPLKEDGHLNVGAIVGHDGYLTVTKDLSMEDNWSGTVELQSGEIGMDFAYYFTLSEQTPTAVSVGVKVNPQGKVESAGALVIQMLPGANDMDISICEHALNGLKPMSTIVEEYDDVSMAQFIQDMFEDAQILDTTDVRFHCDCSKEKTLEILSMMSSENLKKMIEEDHGAEVTCNFCNAPYHISEEELTQLVEKREKNLEISEELEKNVISD